VSVVPDADARTIVVVAPSRLGIEALSRSAVAAMLRRRRISTAFSRRRSPPFVTKTSEPVRTFDSTSSTGLGNHMACAGVASTRSTNSRLTPAASQSMRVRSTALRIP
jgi:hypothetical protein